MNRKEQEKKESQPESWHTNTADSNASGNLIEKAVPLSGAEQTDRNGEYDNP